MAGYSGTPLVKKLGIKSGHRVVLFGEPADFLATLGELPDDAIVARPRSNADIVMLFADRKSDLTKCFAKGKKLLNADGALWLCWPKRASGRVTDLSESDVRHVGLAGGLVDVKVCAVDETWSGLKFVYRLKDRANAG
jgi:hypothetical protein